VVPPGDVSENWYSGVPEHVPTAVNTTCVLGSCGDAWSAVSDGVEQRARRNEIVATVS